MQPMIKNNPALSTKVITNNASETSKLAKQISNLAHKHKIICFFGNLGAGKTTFIKSLISELQQIDESEVSSPTYTYVNSYNNSQDVHHFDLYRLKGKEEFIEMGFEEYLESGQICLIEWSERIEAIIPSNTLCIEISHLGDDKREIYMHVLDKK